MSLFIRNARRFSLYGIDERGDSYYTPKRFHCPACGFEPAENVSEKEYAHCPRCLTAIHEADSEGYECGGKLQPVSIWVKPDDSWEILGRCSLCGEIASTPVSDEDDPILLLSIAGRPLSMPPFPLEKIEELTRMMGGAGDKGGYDREP